MDTKIVVKRVVDFVNNDIWSQDDRRFGRFTRAAIHVAKIVVMTAREFLEQKAMVQASALTYYTLLSLIPVLALAFAIAKGFGLDSILQSYITENIASAESATYILDFVSNTLDNAKGGLIAGIGVVMLLYSVFKLLDKIESTFNYMWCVRTPRSMLRKLTDYVCIIIFAPILLITVLGANIALRSTIIINDTFQDVVLTISPFLLIWVVFTLTYLIMPNAKVKFVPAIISGIVTGTAFQIAQWVYITFQVGVNSAGLIYGSFAFLPLLLAWLQLSWTIVLAGCKIAFSIQNVSQYSLNRGVHIISANLRRTYSLLIMYKSVKYFENQKRVTGIQLANEIEIPQILFFSLVEKLKEAHLLEELKSTNEKEERIFIPALASSIITPRLICQRLDSLGDDDKIHVARTPEFEALSKDFSSDTPISQLSF
ncbi:MAG: YihY/virulence factor BrkB family protein [Bacteroidales bacterium]|nr:YihY/virulence factor BrkB family protein [Bacteroidales bacterium]